MVKSSIPKPRPSKAEASSASGKSGAKASPRLPSAVSSSPSAARRSASSEAGSSPASTTPRNDPAELALKSSEAPVACRPNCALSRGSAGPRIG